MALYSCPNCGHMIHTSAKRCPGCGARISPKASRLKIIATICAFVIAAWIAKSIEETPNAPKVLEAKQPDDAETVAHVKSDSVDLSRPFYSSGVGLICPISALLFNQNELAELFYSPSLFTFESIERKLGCVEVGDGIPMQGKSTKFDPLMVEVNYCPKTNCATTYITSKANLRN